MLHQEIDPKAVLARIAAERVIAAQASAHRTKFDPRTLSTVARKRCVALMLHDGRIVEGRLELGTSERVAVLEEGRSSVTWINTRDVADVDF